MLQAFSKRIHGEKGHKEIMDFAKVDTEGVKPSSFPDIQKHIDDLKAQGGGTREIDLTKGHKTTGTQSEVIGQMGLRLKGKLTVDGTGWKFDGGLEAAKPDRYNFDLKDKTKRSTPGNAATWVGSLFKGIPYQIEFKGSKPVQESNTWSKN